ncbi:MAG: carbon starvation protein A [Atopobiaceae bacterium]|jgi:carbon starvation protein|nr:carbon starvation protein A [Atopobiaceae bacterium]MCH4120396.1 carbon starvation protein A [Atopobiaceae bacterium]MCI1319002.1 carbon starvation protein A [Atopobiaceae bacterium]MCI1389673.1 carbon starvation protein A [Atopobiaceae bacterium]MCI1431925.1 carbon starvation protein A [Atopobiaceae bacterium]
MNGLVVIGIAAVALIIGYVAYGGWLAKTWGIDANSLTPAVRMEDDKDFTPASRFTVFAHQFSSICGAGPVTGTIVAMMFGWLPVLLWVLIGGIFFGAVHDFGALYASVKNNGKSLGQLIEKYIGKTGRRLFLAFSWLFCCIVIAAFTSMVAGTFATTAAADGTVDFAKSYAGGCAGTISILFTFAAIAFGALERRFDLKGAGKLAVAVAIIAVMFSLGMAFPIYLNTYGWIAVVTVYLVFASAMPIQTLKQPRDYITTIMMIAMIACGVLGIVVLAANGNATMTAPMVASSETLDALAANGNYIFPVLFVSVACGALSGFHSLVSSGTSSKQISNETDMRPVGYGAMVLESFVGVIAIVVAGIMYADMNTAGTGALNAGVASTPFQIFAAGIARGMTTMGFDQTISTVFMTMNVSALALTSLDAVARIARTSFQEFFFETNDAASQTQKQTGARKVVTNVWFATVVTLVLGIALCFGGYLNIWPLFGASNQLLGGMTMITLAVFCKCTGRKGWMLYVPVVFLLACTFTSLGMSVYGCWVAVAADQSFAVIATKGLQLVVAILLVVLAVIVAYRCLREFFVKAPGSLPDEEPEWSELGRKKVAEAKRDATAQATSTPTGASV